MHPPVPAAHPHFEWVFLLLGLALQPPSSAIWTKSAAAWFVLLPPATTAESPSVVVLLVVTFVGFVSAPTMGRSSSSNTKIFNW